MAALLLRRIRTIMKGYLSVLGGIIHLLIELTLTLQLPLYSLPTDTQLLLSHSDSFHQTDLSLSHPPFLSHSLSLSLCLSVSPTHTPPALCPSQREHSLFPITLSQPSVYLFIHCGAGGGAVYIHEGPIHPRELPRFSGIWTVPPRTAP